MAYLKWAVFSICIGLTWPSPALGDSAFSALERKLGRFAAHRTAAFLAVGAAAGILRVLLLPILSVPQPKIHDEFAFLLTADTFLRGRLANPAHPLWRFFETFHVLQHPTYSSIYPPGQGAVLALGALIGHPWIGILLSTAAMCAAVTWMLQGWMPARWALLGGALVVFKVGILGYWMNSYWGGSLAAAGAALALGAFPRIRSHARNRDSLIFGIGAAILAVTRPFEGLLFCIPLAAGLVSWVFCGTRRVEKLRALSPILILLTIAASFLGYFNWRVTKNPLVVPESLEIRESITTPVFVWQDAKPPLKYDNPQLDFFYNTWMPSTYRTSWHDALKISKDKAVEFWNFFLGFPLSIPFLALLYLIKTPSLRLIFAQVGLSVAGLLLLVWFHPHYAGPLFICLVLLAVQGMRHLRVWRIRGRPMGISLVRLIVLYSIFALPINLLAYQFPGFANFWMVPEGLAPRYFLLLVVAVLLLVLVRIRRQLPQSSMNVWQAAAMIEFGMLAVAMWQVCLATRHYQPDQVASPSFLRNGIERQLTKLPGEHLVLVKYSQKHNIHEEFVYNAAEIDDAKTVWARDIPGENLNSLLTYFADRDVWILEPDQNPAQFYPYTSKTPASSAFQPAATQAPQTTQPAELGAQPAIDRDSEPPQMKPIAKH